MKILKYYNNKGSILQIVLVLFLILTFFLSLYVTNLSTKYKLYNNLLIMEKQKNYEILLCSYFKKEIKEDLLLSDSIMFENYEFYYDVEANNTYTITAGSEHPYFDYKFIVEIDIDTYQIKRFEYK